jgi:multidrug efflux pump subunit AcrA (membrane-fusion protein)
MNMIEHRSISSRAQAGSLFAALRRPSRAVIIVVSSLVAITAIILWAGFAEIDQLVRARGQVIAVERTQMIEATDNGVLAQMYVREGQMVKKGQLLAQLDQSRVMAAYDDSQNKVAALKAALARLRAEVYGEDLKFPPELDAWPVFKENQRQLFQRRRQALREGIGALETNRNLAAQELAISEPLLASGDVGQAEVIRLKRSRAELDGQIVTLRNRFFQDAQAEMVKAEEDLAAQEELLRERTAVLQMTDLRAPLDGQVKSIDVTTPGAAVRQGEPILQVLPTSGNLIVEAKYLPTDVSSLRVGLPATVKLDAYDSGLYGSLEGWVDYISPDTLTEPGPQGSETIYYRVLVRLDPKLNAASKVKINAGMTATVEVRSRTRTVLSYLTTPITKTLSNSLGER